MLDFDLAELYEVETKRLNEAVKRNIERFPERFMFRLFVQEWENMRSQIATASVQSKRNTDVTPFAFTEHGVTMLSGVLKSSKAIKVNIAVVEAFIALKQFALNYKEIAEKLHELESKYNTHFKDVQQALDYLLKKDKQKVQQEILQKEREHIGYKSK